MGFIKAFAGALGGTFADQWKDFFVPMDATPTSAVIPGIMQGKDASRGSNNKGSTNVITEGSRIIVPDGYAMITMQEGAVTGLVTEPGGFTFTTDDANSQSIFSGGGISTLVSQTWQRFKFGGRAGTEQCIFYVNLKEIPNNRFGTQGEIYWDDAYLNAQVGAVTRGTYSVKIEDPYLFVSKFVPVNYLRPGAGIFDFADMDNDAANQLFTEVVSSLSAAFSNYTNDPSKGNRISRIQGDQIGFAQSLSQAVEDGYMWRSDRGLTIVKVAIAAIEYDEDTKQLLKTVKEADAMGGARANTFSQMAVARGIQGAGENGGGQGIAMMGMGMGAMGGMNMGQVMQNNVQGQPGVGAGALFGGGMPQQGMQQQMDPNMMNQGMMNQGMMNQGMQQGMPQQGMMNQGMQQGMPQQGMPQQQAAPAGGADPMEALAKAKQLLDAGLITQEEYDAKKAEVLGSL